MSIDHRRAVAFAPGEGIEYIRAGWDLDQNLNIYIETAHRVNDLGAVFTWWGYGTSHEGFEAEWRGVNLMTVDGEMVDRSEVFDEADLDDALARFDQLSQPAPRLENAAARVYERILAHFAARDWAAITELLAEYVSTEDRRRVVNAGLRHGRDAVITEIAAIAEVAITNLTSDIIATRGDRLLLSRGRASEADERPDAFRTDLLDIVEIDADERVVARVIFDPDDIDAAFAELDARYLAGEAADDARTWSLIAGAFAAINRHELPELTPDWVNIDHRRGAAFASGDMTPYIHDLLDDTPDINVYVEVVHRLSNLGAVVTQAAHGTSQQGFQAEWREIGIFMFDGDLLSRYELFDDADLATALARFEELHRPAPQLENAVSRMVEQFLTHFAVRDWDAMAELLADDISSDDRRRVLNAGMRRGRDAEMANWRATGDVWVTDVRSSVIATRGAHLALFRLTFASQDQEPEAFQAAALAVVETNDDNRATASIAFDPDDIDAAFEELEARYLAGEAAAHAHTWSVIAAGYAALNRQEVSATTPDYVNIDHRLQATIKAGELAAYVRTAWDLMPSLNNRIETVQRLSDLGAVVTHFACGTSQDGFDAEWRMIELLTVEGDLINRSEMFDEDDIDAALARFEELQPQARRLENASSRMAGRFLAQFAAGDWEAMAEMLVDDYFSDDRRRVVGAGLRHGRDAQMADMRAIADLWITNVTSTVIATRGERLALTRTGYSGRDQGAEAFRTDALAVGEINAAERIAGAVVFDPDDLDAAFAELDARYLAGEAAAHARTWSVIAGAHAAVQSARTSRDDSGSGLHRSSTARIDRGGRSGRNSSCRVGHHSGLQRLHRGSASAETNSEPSRPKC